MKPLNNPWKTQYMFTCTYSREIKAVLSFPCCHSHSLILVIFVCLDMQSRLTEASCSFPSHHQGSSKANKKAHSFSNVS